MFCFAKQKLLITSDNNEYPVTALSRASTQIRFRFATANFGYSDTLGDIFLKNLFIKMFLVGFKK